MRNHSVKDSRPQEPFAYPDATVRVLRRYIRLRYKLVPYLYNLFIEQEVAGDPILRPLFYHFEAEGLDDVNDEFMIGPYILQAPFVERKARSREVLLPGSEPWYDASTGDWKAAGRFTVRREVLSTPLFVAAGAILPMQPGTPVDNQKEIRRIDLHVFVPDRWNGRSNYSYRADDGATFDYRSGAESEVLIELVSADGHLALTTHQTLTGFGSIDPRIVVHGSPRSVRVNGRPVNIKAGKATLVGKPLPVQMVS
jgi:alpha-glucosidase